MSDTPGQDEASVIIVGAGPVGLLTALGLGKAGISTIVLEAHQTLLDTSRAVVYMPVVIPVLQKLGLLETIQRNAFLNREGVAWRNVQGEQLARLQLGEPRSEDFAGVLLIPQARMAALIMEELKKFPSVQIRFGLRCVGIEDSPGAERVKVMVHQQSHADTDLFLHARYVVGTDGSNSSVRRQLCIPFEGFTYQDWKLIGCDVIFDFEKRLGFTPLNFTVDPDDWCVIAYVGQDEGGRPPGSGAPQWRLAYPEPPETSNAQPDIWKRAQERLTKWTAGATDLKILRAEPYILHQRAAARACKGRVFLAGDALHSNNPMGGLGLTGGILDAFTYGNAFARVLKDGEDESLLADCADARRQAWLETTNNLSQANLKRMYGFDPDTVAARDGFFHKLNADQSFHAAVRANFDKMMPNDFEKAAAMA